VFCFRDINEGLRHFTKTTGVKAERALTPEESREVQRELDSLPDLSWLPQTDNSAAIIDHWNRHNTAAWQAAMGTVNPSGALLGGLPGNPAKPKE